MSQWQVTTDRALKAQVNRLQRSVIHRLNEWMNEPEDHLWDRFRRTASRRRCSNLSDRQTSDTADYCIDTINRFAPLMAGLCVDRRRWTCRHFLIGNTMQISWTDSTLFLRMLVIAFRTLLWPSYQVCGRTSCKHVAPSTHPFHNTTEGQTRLHCRSTHSRLSPAVIRSSGTWRQETLPSTLHACHFNTMSSISI
jgi:hypothetical protein